MALAYAQRGYEPDDAAPWAQLTHIVSEADALRGAGYTPADVHALQAQVPIEAAYDLVTTLAEDWVPLALSPEQIRHALLAGLTPDEAAELGEDDWPGIRTLAALLNSPDL